MIDKSNSLITNNLICDFPHIQQKALKIAEESSNDPLYIKFVNKFFLYIPIDYLIVEQIELFNNFVLEAYNFYKIRESYTRKVIIQNTSSKNNPAITIMIINDNKSFIIDSLNCLLTRRNLQPKFILHPMLSCDRDNKGQLTQIHEQASGKNLESLVIINILGNFDDQAIEEITRDINFTLDQVDATNNIWLPMLDYMDNLKQAIEKNQVAYDDLDFPTTESVDFLSWLKNDNFTFLGKLEFSLKNKELIHFGAKPIWENNIEEIKNIIHLSTTDHSHKLIILGRINAISIVHRNNLVDYILIKHIDENGKYTKGIIIFGLYSSMLSYQSIRNIPILSQKFNFVLEKTKFLSQGYNFKKLKIIIESLPRQAIIQIKENDLYCMLLHMLSSMMSKKLKLFIQQDSTNSFVNILIFLPKERLTPAIHDSIIQYLSEKFATKILANYLTEVIQSFSHLFVTISVADKSKLHLSITEIEEYIEHVSTPWSVSLYRKLSDKFGEYQAGLDIKKFEPIFPTDYKNKYNANETIEDINYLLNASSSTKIMFNLLPIFDGHYRLKIYSPNEALPLYNILPSIENLGLKAVDERSFHIIGNKDISESWIYEFILTPAFPIKRDYLLLKDSIENGLEKMNNGELAIDSLGKLITLAGLTWREVKLLKALTRYLHQTGFTYGKGYVQLTLNKHYSYTALLIKYFDNKFNPKTHSTSSLIHLLEEINAYLDNITLSSEDKVLRHLFNLIEATDRTNFYQYTKDGLPKDYLSFKFNSQKILELVRPVPYAEIFVYSNDFEAIHCRGGKEARGGIRWSDRGEDYRTEILGLMKAQMSKNTLIVPVGAKGGFYLLFNSDGISPEEYKNKAIACYKNFLRGLLDITDNIIDGKIIHPIDVVIYDSEDPYLVVAADKGTATFSDFANEVSAEYKFWLADAFASGGSAGYDHKKMGITAKGAWISVKRHFEKMNIDVQKDHITVVGIGDMSGDVFGNGMLQSSVIKLVAAFNHIHIFIDPTPNSLVSYQERLRLFNLPTSKWSDYDNSIISEGGGVFSRGSKLITLTPQIKTLLDITEDEIEPEALIRYILKAPVDLIWNGGIGTYIKATHESHLQIGDKTNDALRCNGKEIRAKVIAEGGNLGVSQLGRIEYNKNGGEINTDFIDNSGGVDCSDHEVNIKIALNTAVRMNQITLTERNELLVNMTKEVEELVLLDNVKQIQAITIAYYSPAFTIGMFSELINSLEKEKLLDRSGEYLPSESELSKRANEKQKITRPELAIILSYSKIACFNALDNQDIFKDPYFETFLLSYFPSQMREKFKDIILDHPLRDAIIKTVVTNKIVNQLGGVLINTLQKETGGNIAEIISTFLIVCEIFELDDLWNKVESLDSTIDHNIKIDMFTELTKIMRRGSAWFIKNATYPINIRANIEEFKNPAKDLSTIVNNLLSGEAKDKFNLQIGKYINAGIQKELAQQISTLDSLVSIFDIITIANSSKTDHMEIANIYFWLGNQFNIDWLRSVCDQLIDDSYLNRLSIQSLKDDLYDKQKRLLMKIISQIKHSNTDFNKWIDDNKTIYNVFSEFVTNIKLQENINLNMIILANKKFEIFLRKLG